MKMKTMLAAVMLMGLSALASAQSYYTLSPSTPATTGVVIASGSGSFLGIEIATGSAADFCVVIDSAAAIASPSGDTRFAKKLATLSVVATNTTTSLVNIARPFVNGVSVWCSAARTVGLWITQ